LEKYTKKYGLDKFTIVSRLMDRYGDINTTKLIKEQNLIDMVCMEKGDID